MNLFLSVHYFFNITVYYCIMSNNRKDLLLAKLKENNLEFREDSGLYKQYINEERDDLEFIVNTMIEMDFYMNSTMYKLILKKDKFEAKREDKDWNDDKEEAIRQKSKQKAIKNYIFKNKKNLDEMNKIPQSIKTRFKL